MSYSRYLQAIAKGLHDQVLPQLEAGQARDVLTNSLRALAALAANMDPPPDSLLTDLDGTVLPPALAAIAPAATTEVQGLLLPTAGPVDDFAVNAASVALIRSGALWLGAEPWLASLTSRKSAMTLLRWEHGLRTHAVAGIARIEQGRMMGEAANAEATDLDPQLLQAYLRLTLNSPDLCVSDFRFLPGGRVRQTAIFRISGHRGGSEKLVVQRDNPAGLTAFKGPAMQYKLLEVLHAVGMRVPRPLLVEADTSVLGGAFLICEQLPGKSPVPSMDYFSPPPQSEQLARSLARQLAILHGAPIDGLSQVLTATLDSEQNPNWMTDTAKMEAAWNASAHAPSMAIAAAFAWMRTHAEEIADHRSVVHGDLLLHNVLADGNEISAVLDWEVAHIGHPAEDLGYLRPVIEQMMAWDQFLDEYVRAGGIAPTALEIDFFTLRALTTLSVWVQYARAAFEEGRTADFNMAEVGSSFLPKLINRLAQQIIAVLERS